MRNSDEQEFAKQMVKEDREEEKADSKLFAVQQKEDESLTKWWELAKRNESEFAVVNNLLYRVQRNLTGKMYQLVLPKCRRIKVLELAHDSIFGGHLAFMKTFERVKMSFAWLKMRNNIFWYCKTCKLCQLSAKGLVTDRVPIIPIAREQIRYRKLNIDCIGAIASHNRWYTYIHKKVSNASHT